MSRSGGGRVSDPGRLYPDMRGERDLDRRISVLATEQHGVVGRRQLRDIGLSNKNIDYRLAAGRLIRISSGVFAVGHGRLTREGRWMAAVLGCGERAVLSHHDAAALWGLTPTRGTL